MLHFYIIVDGGYGGGYGQSGYNQSWNQNQGGWSSDYGNTGYGNSYGGGPMRGGNNYSHRSGGPYGGKGYLIFIYQSICLTINMDILGGYGSNYGGNYGGGGGRR